MPSRVLNAFAVDPNAETVELLGEAMAGEEIGEDAAYVDGVELTAVGGLDNLFSHPNVVDRLDFFPDLTDLDVAIPLFFVPLAVQWWAAWYPGAEPGGGGYRSPLRAARRLMRSAPRA